MALDWQCTRSLARQAASDRVPLQRTFREVMFLQELTRHDNIIKCAYWLSCCTAHAVPAGCSADDLAHPRRLLNVLKADNDRDLYLTFDFMETDLHAVIRANILEEVHKQYIMYQLLKALKYLHSAELIHRDIKVCLPAVPSQCQCRCWCAPASPCWPAEHSTSLHSRQRHSYQRAVQHTGPMQRHAKLARCTHTCSPATCCSTASAVWS